MKIRKMGNVMMQTRVSDNSEKSLPGISIGADSSEAPKTEMNQDDVVKTKGTDDFNERSIGTGTDQHKNVAVSRDLEKQLAKQRKRTKALSRMGLFPLILIVSWVFGTIRRFIELIGGSAPVWLVCVHIGMASLVGFFDALVYGLTKDVRQKDKELCQQKCGCNNAEFEED